MKRRRNAEQRKRANELKRARRAQNKLIYGVQEPFRLTGPPKGASHSTYLSRETYDPLDYSHPLSDVRLGP